MKSTTANMYVADECGQAHDVLLDRFELTALPHNAAVARERIREICSQLGFEHLETGEIEVAFGEAVNNAILYGSPHPDSRIAVSCCLRRLPQPGQSAVVIQVRDQGKGFDPQNVPAPEVGTDALGGRGIGLMRALMDAVALFHDGSGMIVRMARLVPAAKQA
ncbi:MAG TPA: ATP-binding protein [Capsulimonadaceae bacterium]|nr:ATP-binding protein [Capsulimonadaceae bacterium]